MEIHNYTPFSSFCFESQDVDDTRFQIMVVRGSFSIIPERPLQLAEKQSDLVFADQYYNEVNTSSVCNESDLSPFKPRSDIVVNAYGYAPRHVESTEWKAAVTVGSLRKELLITGARIWYYGFASWKLTAPQPCIRVPIRYEYAYGGIWLNAEGQNSAVYEQNPVGTGFIQEKYLRTNAMTKAPQITCPKTPVTHLFTNYQPQGLGIQTRSWLPRRSYAGTYDQAWLKNRHPNLPADFKFDFYNCAHPDLQYNGYLRGDEDVLLENLHPKHEILQFALPGLQMGLLLQFEDNQLARTELRLDTLQFDLEDNLAYLVWRGQIPKHKILREIAIHILSYQNSRNAMLSKQSPNTITKGIA